MAVRMIKSVQKIPASLEVVWEVFSNPTSLHRITPGNMNFRIISKPSGAPVYAGQILEYKVSPLLGIPLYWKTEIIEVKEKEFFIDEQRKGPYKLWRHQHHFRTIDGGVEMTDIVEYENPWGIVGKWANTLLVRKKLRRIFEYRFKMVEEIFGKWKDQKPVITIS